MLATVRGKGCYKPDPLYGFLPELSPGDDLCPERSEPEPS